MPKKPNGYWTFDRCKEEACKYSKKSNFEKGSGSAYIIALRNGWINKICSHMSSPQRASGHWTKSACLKEASKYKTASDFEKFSPGAYDASRKHGIYKKCCQHMQSPQKEKGFWTKSKCLEEAKKYSSISEFQKGSRYAYQKSLKNGWLESAEFEIKRQSTDADVFYVWKSSYKSKAGIPIYKVGVTSKRLGERRIYEGKYSLGSDSCEIIIYKFSENAYDLESFAKNIGRRWNGTTGPGYTEMVELSDKDIKRIMDECEGRNNGS